MPSRATALARPAPGDRAAHADDFDLADDATYRDKVHGGWVGKCAGGILGAPIEGFKTFNDIQLSDELFANNFANDDLDLQVLWLDMVAREGAAVRETDFAAHWLRHVAFPWNEYGIATRNIKLGLDPPDTGNHNNWYWRESMGSPIRSEIWGMLFPGDPARAARYARMDSELDHDGFSVAAEMFFSACAAIAFVEPDPRAVLERSLAVLPEGASCARLVREVSDWHEAYGFAAAAAKVKSAYGDADFTSAPMNVAFTVLAVLHAGRDFDLVVEALHLGHDSDCVVATAAALIGICVGYDRLPATWRRRVGDELLISPEVSGVDCPPTLTALTDKTVRVAREIAREATPAAAEPAVHASVESWPDYAAGRALKLAVHLENLGAAEATYGLDVSSDYLRGASATLTLAPGAHGVAEVELPVTRDPAALTEPRLPYALAVTRDGREEVFRKGIPYYGEWLLVGPFVEADDARIPMDTAYPDHGLPSMPSVRYMNHDRDNRGTAFVDHATLSALLDGDDRDGRPYQVAVVRPGAMAVDLGEYFWGRGERTLYLTTRVYAEAATRKWLALGAAAYVTAWLNGREVLPTSGLVRRWPGAHAAELELEPGANIVTIRLDAVTDDFRLDVGFKDHEGRHAHQSQWDIGLVPTVTPRSTDEAARA